MNREENTIIQGSIDLDSIFERAGKYNKTVRLTEEDKKARVKIYCMEPYAQGLYDKMVAFERGTGVTSYTSKDLEEGSIHEVKATSISFDDKIISVEETFSKISIGVPFKEYSGNLESLAKGENLYFNVMITKNDKKIGYIGSEKSCASINYRKELSDHYQNNTWFEVKITRLIKGGYIALYKDTVECFIPGSHAAANVIRDFKVMIGKTLSIMVDNYDTSNDLFILSYKKYIEHSMPQMIADLSFGTKYTGTLTNKPYDFGMFVEFENYFTGLIHSSEFTNYDSERNQYKSGDQIDFYVKNVTKKGNQYRVILTLKEEEIDAEKKKWSCLS